MKSIVVFVAFLALAAAAPATSKNINQHWLFMDDSERIVGGTETTIQQFPHMVSLQIGTSHTCGGSIINANHILTAAHCSTRTATDYYVRVGSTSRTTGGQHIRCSDKRVNSGYSSSTLDNDSAVFKLASSITLDGSTRKAIALASSLPSVGSASVVSGWGTTSSGGTSSPTNLRRVTAPVISDANCKSAYGSSSITGRMVCAGYMAGGQDSCQGDSGGPLIFNNQQIGIVSWGRGCALSGYPGVYSNVPALKSWIDSNSNF